MGRGKTAIRGGIGLFYENVLTVVCTVRSCVPRENRRCLQTRHRLPAMGPPTTSRFQPPPATSSRRSVEAPGPVAIGAVADQIAAFQKQYQADCPLI